MALDKFAFNLLNAKASGENAMGADNQQERLGNWTVGFVDGEGCFHVAINRQPKMKLGWQVLPEFRVVQHKRDEKILNNLVKMFGCGSVVNNHGDRKEFRVRGLENLKHIISFFEKNPLQTTKQESFERFAKIIKLMCDGKHKSSEGLRLIANLAWQMNRQVKPKFLESSETVRQTS